MVSQPKIASKFPLHMYETLQAQASGTGFGKVPCHSSPYLHVICAMGIRAHASHQVMELSCPLDIQWTHDIKLHPFEIQGSPGDTHSIE